MYTIIGFFGVMGSRFRVKGSRFRVNGKGIEDGFNEKGIGAKS
jgi:hypothetical protein